MICFGTPAVYAIGKWGAAIPEILEQAPVGKIFEGRALIER